MEQFILQIILLVIVQLFIIFGIFFVFGFILTKLQKWTLDNYQKSVGWKGIFWTGWLGTPIHELSHIIFAKVFFHKINRVALFQPDFATGELGWVDHSYSEKSFYQNIGNFFIALGPMIFGSIILVILLIFLVPNGLEIFNEFSFSQLSFVIFCQSIWQILVKLFNLANISSWHFWLFLYTSFCIATHMSPSKQDRRGMWQGLLFIIFSLLVFDIFAFILQFDATKLILKIMSYFSIFIAVFSYAVIISFIHFLATKILFWPFKKYH